MKRVAPAVIWSIIILVATLTPGNQLPRTPDVIGLDKVAHFSLFLILTLLWNRGWTDKTHPENQLAKIITNYLVFGIFFAILVEYLQQFIPGRSFDYGDMAANIIGSTIGTICFYILYRKQSTLV